MLTSADSYTEFLILCDSEENICLIAFERRSQEYAYGQSKLHASEQGTTTGTDGRRGEMTREFPWQEGFNVGHTERRILDPWTTSPAYDYWNDSA